MTDLVSDLLTASVVAIVLTIAITTIFVLSGTNREVERLLELPFYQLVFCVWCLLVIIISWFIRSNEMKMYES